MSNDTVTKAQLVSKTFGHVLDCINDCTGDRKDELLENFDLAVRMRSAQPFKRLLKLTSDKVLHADNYVTWLTIYAPELKSTSKEPIGWEVWDALRHCLFVREFSMIETIGQLEDALMKGGAPRYDM